jgi:ribonucleotide reductase beta subunit family protein with ferritin-like domain/glutaredoxin
MAYTLFSKNECIYCDKAKEFFESKGITPHVIPCDSIQDLSEKLGPFCPKKLASFPFIVGPHGKTIGGYEQLLDSFEEPMLQEDISRFSVFPLQHQDIFDIYLKSVASFWTADEISLRQDATDFQTLSNDEQHFIKYVLSFFASSDGIVNENLMGNFSNEVQFAEARQMYAYQTFNEAEHNRTYSLLIDTLITNPIERDMLFNAITQVHAVKKKAAWAMKWLDPLANRFAERLVAFNCVEGILFSGSFCAIYWLKQQHRGKMPGLSLSNQFISRDEGLHCEHASLLYRKLHRKLSQQTVERIVGEAVANEKEFITEAIPCSLVGMNVKLMSEYIEFVADKLLVDLGHSKMFHTPNPFPWMELISLEGKTNFFESRVSEYSRAGVNDPTRDMFQLDEDF